MKTPAPALVNAGQLSVSSSREKKQGNACSRATEGQKGSRWDAGRLGTVGGCVVAEDMERLARAVDKKSEREKGKRELANRRAEAKLSGRASVFMLISEP